MSAFSVAFNSVTNDYEVTLTGTGFPQATNDVHFLIDGFEQSVISSTETQIKITITQMLTSSSYDINLYLPTGTPSGAFLLTDTGITLEPIMF